MSLTRTVPAAVPSLFHSSVAVRAVVGREEQRPVHVRQAESGWKPCVPGPMSLTRTVPAAVPSLFHSSIAAACRRWPRRSSVAVHVRRGSRGSESELCVRADVLDEHGAGRGAVALPQLVAVRAVVGREEQRPVHVRQRSEEPELPPPGLMSLTRTVPAAVPSLFHSSTPLRAVVGREEQRAVHVRRGRPGSEPCCCRGGCP